MSDSVNHHRTFEVLTAEPLKSRRKPRHWSDEDKARLVAEALAPGSNVSAIARSHGLDPSQLYAWRRKALASGAVSPLRGGQVKPVRFTAMSKLWEVEDEVRGKNADRRTALRQEKSAAIVASLFEQWEKELGKVSGKSKTAEAIRYALTRREALERFLTDGRIEIDSNIVERAIRPQTITRKNSLFAGSEGGGRTWATVATLLQTAKMNNVDPLAWLSQTLTRIAQRWSAAEIAMLMPWNFEPDAIS